LKQKVESIWGVEVEAQELYASDMHGDSMAFKNHMKIHQYPEIGLGKTELLMMQRSIKPIESTTSNNTV
jgi:hypothetical protein